MSRPPAGAKRRRKNANALTTIELAVAPTSKLCANCGSTGRISPNPRAMTNADATRTHSSRGMRTAAVGWVRGVTDTIHQYAVSHRRSRIPAPGGYDFVRRAYGSGRVSPREPHPSRTRSREGRDVGGGTSEGLGDDRS